MLKVTNEVTTYDEPAKPTIRWAKEPDVDAPLSLLILAVAVEIK